MDETTSAKLSNRLNLAYLLRNPPYAILPVLREMRIFNMFRIFEDAAKIQEQIAAFA